MIIGVSGKSGSGKSSVSRYIAEKLNYVHVDIDLLSKKIREEYKEEILQLVKENIVDNNKIDSKKLGNILFTNKELMNKYNRFIYSKQLIEIKEYINKYENIILDSMFLPIMDEIYEKVDFKVLVYLDDEKRMKRILKRDSISEEYYKKRDSYPLDYSKYIFDLVINNNIDYKEQVDKFLSNYI